MFLGSAALIYLGITAVLITANRPTAEVNDGPPNFGTLTTLKVEPLLLEWPYFQFFNLTIISINTSSC